MKAFDPLRAIFHQRMMSQEEANIPIDRKLVNFNEAQSVGILFDASDIKSHIIITDYKKELKKLGKKVDLMGFVNAKKAQQMSFPIFSKEDLNWYYKPISSKVNDFIAKPFDILINAYFFHQIPLHYISTFSQSKFRVGAYLPGNSNQDHADMMIDLKSQADLSRFFSEINHYFKIIKNQHEHNY